MVLCKWQRRRVLVHRDSSDGSQKTQLLAQALVLMLWLEQWLPLVVVVKVMVVVLLKRLEGVVGITVLEVVVNEVIGVR